MDDPCSAHGKDLGPPMTMIRSTAPTATQPQAMTAAERGRHIQSLSDHFMAAYRRFEDFGLASDRDEACQWLHLRDQAVRERLIDVGNDFFQTAGARDAQAMRTPEHA